MCIEFLSQHWPSALTKGCACVTGICSAYYRLNFVDILMFYTPAASLKVDGDIDFNQVAFVYPIYDALVPSNKLIDSDLAA
jgi:hypothetical protein